MAVRRYPHVAVSKYAIPRTEPVVEESTAPVMFVPFRAEKGPANELRKIYTLGEFISTYGEGTFDNSDTEQELLNISNWLSNGGAILALRLADSTYDTAKSYHEGVTLKRGSTPIGVYDVALEAKYPGRAYHNLKVRFSKVYSNIQVTVLSGKTQLEKFSVTPENYKSRVEFLSQYFKINEDNADGIYVKGFEGCKVTHRGSNYYIDLSSNNITLVPETGESVIKYNGKHIFLPTKYASEFYIVTLNSNDDFYTLNGAEEGQLYQKEDRNLIATGIYLYKTATPNEYYAFKGERLEGDTNKVILTDLDDDQNYTCSVTHNSSNITIESVIKTPVSDLYKVPSDLIVHPSSEFFTDLFNEVSFNDITITCSDGNACPGIKANNATQTVEFTFAYDDVNPDSTRDTLLTNFLDADSGTLCELKDTLKNKLETPFDVIMDASYPNDIKKKIIDVFAVDRDDVHFFIDLYNVGGDTEQNTKESANDFLKALEGSNGLKDEYSEQYPCQNISYYAQYFVVANPYTDNDIKVGPTYFLSSLIAENDLKYGTQKPTAGLSRGVLTGVKYMSSNPSPAKKDEFYENKINYVERDSRGYRFMCQLTKDVNRTALSFINNSRTVNVIARNIEKIGRNYLFEFNDSTTLSNMKSEMNKYLGEWIQNRTLNYADLQVEQSGETSVDVSLDIRFTGTIEIISVAITIE